MDLFLASIESCKFGFCLVSAEETKFFWAGIITLKTFAAMMVPIIAPTWIYAALDPYILVKK